MTRPTKTGEQINKEGFLENGVLAKICAEEKDEVQTTELEARLQIDGEAERLQIDGEAKRLQIDGRSSGGGAAVQGGGQRAEGWRPRADGGARRWRRRADAGGGAALFPPGAALATRTGKPRPTSRGGEGRPRGK